MFRILSPLIVPVPSNLRIISRRLIFFQSYHGILLSILIFMFCPIINLAQIKISEKIVIEPPHHPRAKSIKGISSAGGHSLRALHTWQQVWLGADNDIPMQRMRFKFTADNCGEIIFSDFDYSGTLDFSTTQLLGTSYTIKLLLSTRTLWDPVYRYEHEHGAPFQIFIDGEEKSMEDDYWFGDIALQISQDQISYGELGSNLNIYTQKSCSPIIGRINIDYPTITILEGEDYLSFYDETADDTIGNSFYSGDFIDRDFPVLICDEPYFKSSPLIGIVEATINGFSAVDSIIIKNVEDFELIVSSVPDRISPGEESQILLKYIGLSGDTLDFEQSQVFDVEIIEGADFGTIVNNNSLDTSDIHLGIPQGFKFRASEMADIDSAEILIKVSSIIDEESSLQANFDPQLNSISRIIDQNLNQSKDDFNIKKSGDKKANAAFFIPPDGPRRIFGVGRIVIADADSLDHFELVIIPDSASHRDTLAFTETASLFVAARDADSNDIEFDMEKSVHFILMNNNNYGTFITSEGDTVNNDRLELRNVPYEDAKNGRIKFAALFQNPDSIVKCRIKVVSADDTSKCGIRDAVVLEQTVRIIMNQPYEVEPIITGHRYDPEFDTYLQNIREKNRKSFSVLITRGGVKQNDHAFKLTADYLNGSGGHDHNLPRRPSNAFSYMKGSIQINVPEERARRQNYGSFYADRGFSFNPDSLHGKVLIRSKDDTVSCFEYISSIWGDSVKIFAESIENSKLNKDSVLLVEKIPGLYPLSNDQNYILVGGTANHKGPPGFAEDHNHYGTQILNDAIKLIADNYQKSFPGMMIRVNDMSLTNGGKFDIMGNWMGSHASHRMGNNVDISGYVVNNENQLITIHERKMREIITDITEISPIFHNPPHFHVFTK